MCKGYILKGGCIKCDAKVSIVVPAVWLMTPLSQTLATKCHTPASPYTMPPSLLTVPTNCHTGRHTRMMDSNTTTTQPHSKASPLSSQRKASSTFNCGAAILGCTPALKVTVRKLYCGPVAFRNGTEQMEIEDLIFLALGAMINM